MFSTPETHTDNERIAWRHSPEELAALNDTLYGSLENHEQTEVEQAIVNPETGDTPGLPERNIGDINTLHVKDALSERAEGKIVQVSGADASEPSVAGQHLKGVASDAKEGTIENQDANAQAEAARSEVERVLANMGVENPNGDTEERILAGRIEYAVSPKSNDDMHEGKLGSAEITEVTRASIASEAMGALLEGNTEVLSRLDAGAAEKVIAWMQGVRERGGAEKVCNEEMAWLGKIIEQGEVGEGSGEMLEYVTVEGEVRQVEKNNRLRGAALDWLDGNTHSALRSTPDIPPEANDQIYYYLETVRERYDTTSQEVREYVLGEIQKMLLMSQRDSDRSA